MLASRCLNEVLFKQEPSVQVDQEGRRRECILFVIFPMSF